LRGGGQVCSAYLAKDKDGCYAPLLHRIDANEKLK
jgi:hypothetical protein